MKPSFAVLRSTGKQRGFQVAILVPLLVVGVWQWHALRVSGVRKMADELGSVPEFFGSIKANHANTKLFFVEQSTNGAALYYCDLNGKKQFLDEVNHGYSWLFPLGWSPDDQLFAYAFDRKVWIRKGDTGERLAEIPVVNEPRPGFAWLSPASFAVSSNGNLYVFTRQDRRWKGECVSTNVMVGVPRDPGVYRPIIYQPLSIVPLSERSIAWLQEGAVWKLDFGGIPQKLWSAETNPVMDLAASPGSGYLLLNCSTNGEKLNGGMLLGLKVRGLQEPARNLGELHGAGDFAIKISLINNSEGVAYLSARMWRGGFYPSVPTLNNTLYVKKNAASEPARVLGEGEVMDYTANGNFLYVIGSQSGEPCGIWKYDINSGSLTNVYAARHSFKYTTFARHQHGLATNDDGRVVSYHLWTPDDKSPGKKHPMLLGQVHYGATSKDAHLAVRSGWCYAFADRPSSNLQKWSEDVLCVYKELAKNPCIDANRVFLFGASIETSYATRLIEDRPEFFKGAFFESPFGGPDPSRVKSHVEEIAAVKERQDPRQIALLSKYQEKAALDGIRLRLVLRDGEHVAVGIPAYLGHLRALTDLLVQEN